MLKRLALAVLVATFAVATPAYAHVTVSSPDAAPGGYTVLTFRVPTESDTASTTKLAVQLPTFAFVSVQPKTGWTFTTKTTKLTTPVTDDDGNQLTSAISEVDWTATGDGIKPGEFDEFSLEVGPLPDADEVSFGTLQTYSDGSTVAWNQTAAPGSDTEPEHPKATLTLTAVKPTEPASTTGATILSIIALIVAAAALGVAIVSNARRKS